jgi:hypothetical protein
MTENSDTHPTSRAPRFCDQCGLSVIPLQGMYVQRSCNECGKDTYVVEIGDAGKGIKIREGDKFHLTGLRISINPADGGNYTRYGLKWFIRSLVTSEAPC